MRGAGRVPGSLCVCGPLPGAARRSLSRTAGRGTSARFARGCFSERRGEVLKIIHRTKTRRKTMATTESAAAVSPGKLFIGGEWVDAASGKTFDTVNPATGEVL